MSINSDEEERLTLTNLTQRSREREWMEIKSTYNYRGWVTWCQGKNHDHLIQAFTLIGVIFASFPTFHDVSRTSRMVCSLLQGAACWLQHVSDV